MDIQDIADLIYVRDAYKAMNKSLHGEEMVLGFHEGYLGALGRVFRVIERNISEKWKKDDDSAMRILDAISLSPEERARLLLEEEKCRIGEGEVLKKYEFNKKLKEGVLTGRIKGQAAVIIDGIESKARCNAMGKVGMRGIPCLVSENNSRGSMQFTIEAVSHDSKDGREWICINPMLIEQAVGFFLENHQREKMVGCCDHVNNVSTATAEKGRPDFQAGNAWIEVRVLRRESRGFVQQSLASSMRQVEKYCQQLSAMQGMTERMILLLVCQGGIEEEQISFKEKASDEIKKTVGNGVEIWTAEMQFDADGISLLSYQNITDRILDN